MKTKLNQRRNDGIAWVWVVIGIFLVAHVIMLGVFIIISILLKKEPVPEVPPRPVDPAEEQAPAMCNCGNAGGLCEVEP